MSAWELWRVSSCRVHEAHIRHRVSSTHFSSLEEKDEFQTQLQFRKKSGELQLFISFCAGAVTLTIARGSYRSALSSACENFLT